MTIRSHKICLRPTPKQARAFTQAVGNARFAYNWALAQWQAEYEAGGKPNEGALRRELNAVKREKFAFLTLSPKAVVQQAVKNLGAAYDRFFKAQKGGAKSGYPRFKKRGARDSARLDNGPGTFEVHDSHVKLPRYGRVKTHEALRFKGEPISATLSREGERWFLSVSVKLFAPMPSASESQGRAGIDLGVKTAVVTSDGREYHAPKPLKKGLRKMRRLNKSLSRKRKGSRNREKARQRLSRLHWRIAQIRSDWAHKTSRSIANAYGTVFMEDLNVSGMKKVRSLARAISDVGMGELRRQLCYKTNVVFVSRWFPSSQLCSECGTQNKALTLAEREWTCPCGAAHCRDRNAAINIFREGERVAKDLAGKPATIPRVTRKFKPVETSASTPAARRAQAGSVKQEPERFYVLHKS